MFFAYFLIANTLFIRFTTSEHVKRLDFHLKNLIAKSVFADEETNTNEDKSESYKENKGQSEGIDNEKGVFDLFPAVSLNYITFIFEVTEFFSHLDPLSPPKTP